LFDRGTNGSPGQVIDKRRRRQKKKAGITIPARHHIGDGQHGLYGQQQHRLMDQLPQLVIEHKVTNN